MSLVVGLVAAAVAGLGGALVARIIVMRRRRDEAPALPAPASSPSEPPEETLPFGIGDVLQHGDATRWPQCQLQVRHDGTLHCCLLLSRDRGRGQATVVFAPPRRDVLWLEAVSLSLPLSPPSRLEVKGQLLDRQRLLHVELASKGLDAPEADREGIIAFYDGSVGDAAVVLMGAGEPRIYYGRRLREGDYESLGQVDAEGSDG